MQSLVEFLPIIVFFGVYKGYGWLVSADDALYAATAALMVVMAIQISVQWIRTRTVNKVLLVSGGLVLILGGITLFVRNPLFIQWKTTVFYWVLALALFASRYIGDRTLIERAMGHMVELPVSVWRAINLSWAIFFLIVGATNIYVVYHFSESAWVNFKVYGVLGLTILMALIQGIWMARYMPDEEKE